MTCKRCKKDKQLSSINGYEGLCTECECHKMENEFEEQAQSELSAYNKKHNTLYDFEEFYFACQDNKIDRDGVAGLPMLYGVLEIVEDEKKYLNQNKPIPSSENTGTMTNSDWEDLNRDTGKLEPVER